MVNKDVQQLQELNVKMLITINKFESYDQVE